MKYYILAGIVILAGITAVVISQNQAPQEDAAVAEWKRVAVENETKVRPSSFEELKWTPEAAVEMRAPASKKK